MTDPVTDFKVGEDDPNSIISWRDCRQLASEIADRNPKVPISGVVVLLIRGDGVVDVASYAAGGGDRKASLAEWARGLLHRQLPKAPFQTMFGWGNGGKAKKLSAAETKGFGPGQLAWLELHTAADAVD